MLRFNEKSNEIYQKSVCIRPVSAYEAKWQSLFQLTHVRIFRKKLMIKKEFIDNVTKNNVFFCDFFSYGIHFFTFSTILGSFWHFTKKLVYDAFFWGGQIIIWPPTISVWGGGHGFVATPHATPLGTASKVG